MDFFKKTTRLFDLTPDELIEVCQLEPGFVFPYLPYEVWKNNRTWVMQFERGWACENFPLIVLAEDPVFFCLHAPADAFKFDPNLVIKHNLVWVVKNKAEFLATFSPALLDTASHLLRQEVTLAGKSKLYRNSLLKRIRSMLPLFYRGKSDNPIVPNGVLKKKENDRSHLV